MAKTSVAKAEDLSKEYGTGKMTVHVLKSIDLEAAQGDFIAIQGPSGAGKTTLLNMLGCLDTPTTGKVLIENVDTTRMGEKRLAAIRCRRIGFVFQFYNLMPNMPALQNVELPMIFARTPKKQRMQKAQKLLQTVGLALKLQNTPSQLSAGEQQRVAIARALANDPAVVLMDEPTGNLDKENMLNIMNLLKQLNETQKQTIILTTHNPSTAEFAHRTLLLQDGKLRLAHT